MNTIDERDIDESLDEAAMVANDRKEESLPEAPAVSNVKVWIKGYGVMLTVRGEKMMDIVKKTETLVDYAISHGWKNVWDTVTTPIKSLPNLPPIDHPEWKVDPITGKKYDTNTTTDVSSKNQPTCPVHGATTKWLEGVSKKTGKPYAFWTCSSKNSDESYCNAELKK